MRENQKQILVSLYEALMAKPGEELTIMFERFNKIYNRKEVNLKFLLTLPDHLERRVTDTREAINLNNVSLKTLYGALKS